MHGRLVAAMIDHPAAQLPQLVRRVIRAGNHQIRQLDPHARLAPQPFDRVEHRLQMRIGDLVVKILGEAFQVDIRGIHELEKRSASGRRNIARCYRNRRDPRLAACPRRVDRVFGPNHRIVVGKRHAAAVVPFRRRDNRVGRRELTQTLHLARLRDIPILAKLAAQIAARRAERQHAGAGEEMIERLLFDRIDTKTGAPAVGRQHHFVVDILAYETETAVPRLQMALPRAQIADDPAMLGVLVPPATRERAVGTQTARRRIDHHSGHTSLLRKNRTRFDSLLRLQAVYQSGHKPVARRTVNSRPSAITARRATRRSLSDPRRFCQGALQRAFSHARNHACADPHAGSALAVRATLVPPRPVTATREPQSEAPCDATRGDWHPICSFDSLGQIAQSSCLAP